MSLYLLLGKEGRTLIGSICWFLYYKYSQYGQFETWCQLALKIPQIWAISFFEWLKAISYTLSQQVELKQSWKEFIRLQLSLLRLFYVCVGGGCGQAQGERGGVHERLEYSVLLHSTKACFYSSFSAMAKKQTNKLELEQTLSLIKRMSITYHTKQTFLHIPGVYSCIHFSPVHWITDKFFISEIYKNTNSDSCILN